MLKNRLKYLKIPQNCRKNVKNQKNIEKLFKMLENRGKNPENCREKVKNNQKFLKTAKKLKKLSNNRQKKTEM